MMKNTRTPPPQSISPSARSNHVEVVDEVASIESRDVVAEAMQNLEAAGFNFEVVECACRICARSGAVAA